MSSPIAHHELQECQTKHDQTVPPQIRKCEVNRGCKDDKRVEHVWQIVRYFTNLVCVTIH